MFTKTSKVITLIVISAILLAVLVSAGFYLPRQPTVGSASSTSTQFPVAKSVEEAQILQAEKQEALVVTQNDITVQVTSARVVDTGLEIGICYTALDNGEWRPLPNHIFYGTSEIYPDEIEFLADEIFADRQNTGTRCALIRYRIDDVNTVTTPIKFSILEFYAPGREMYSPCEELQQRLATNAQARSLGLNSKCEENADGSMNITLVGNNPSVTTEEAQKALHRIASAEIPGNWEFTITNIKR